MTALRTRRMDDSYVEEAGHRTRCSNHCLQQWPATRASALLAGRRNNVYVGRP